MAFAFDFHQSGKFFSPLIFPHRSFGGENTTFPFQRSSFGLAASPSRALPCDQGGLIPLELPIDLFHKSINPSLFLGSLPSARNHARSPPDDFRTSLPAFKPGLCMIQIKNRRIKPTGMIQLIGENSKY